MNQYPRNPRDPRTLRPRTPQSPTHRPSGVPVRRGVRRRKPKPPFLPIPILLGLLTLLIVIASFALASRSQTDLPGDSTTVTDTGHSPSTGKPDTGKTESHTDVPVIGPGDTNPPAPQITYKDITLLSAGDIMFHYNNMMSGYDSATKTYSYTDVFRYIAPIVSQYDYAVANLETTLSGASVGYTPKTHSSFNTPDAALDAIKGAGFDMMLFANNHTYDRGIYGVKRTVSFLEENDMDVIGAIDDKSDSFYKIVNIGGVKVGMLNYTNDGTWNTGKQGYINGIKLKNDDGDYINLFYLDALEEFYEKVEQDLSEIRAAGADLVVFYIHWGPEYYIEPRDNTKEIAQALCDLGVDAIIGSHPHVVQGVETLTSSRNPNHKTLCFYSLGNLISNQNRKSLSAEYCKGNNVNTENGLMVVLTIRKYSTGETLIVKAETIPTWVHRYTATDGSGPYDYRIIPLRAALANPDAYRLGDSATGLTWATEALSMTSDLIDSAIAAFNSSVNLPTGLENAVPE